MGLWPKKERGDLLGISTVYPLLSSSFFSFPAEFSGRVLDRNMAKEERKRKWNGAPFQIGISPRENMARREGRQTRLAYLESAKKSLRKREQERGSGSWPASRLQNFEETSIESQILFFPNLGAVHSEGHEFREKGRSHLIFEMSRARNKWQRRELPNSQQAFDKSATAKKKPQ